MSVAGGLRQIVDAMRTLRISSPCSVGRLEQIVGGANHRPLASDFVEARQQPEVSGLLDLSEHRLDDLLAQPVAATPAGDIALCTLALAATLLPSSATCPSFTKPAARHSLSTWTKKSLKTCKVA